MPASCNCSLSQSAIKPHYHILDGLRGVAAVMVVWFHVFEAFATSHLDQGINHGYLAVDFFFILSGFVVGYAYDDRWGKMSVRDFIKRRLIRLHPMLVMGALLGGVTYCLQATAPAVTAGALAVAVLLNALLIPSSRGMEIRGYGETYPLNGPCWSLFFEYVGNILYALFIRRFSTAGLACLTVLAGAGLCCCAVMGANGDLNAGWTMTAPEMTTGLMRVMFSFTAGLFLTRIFKPISIKGAFRLCGAVLIGLLSMPRIGAGNALWMNGIYDMICVAVFFPALVYLGASGQPVHPWSTRICDFLGRISYPLYIVHYPFMYIYFGWVHTEDLSFLQSLPGALAVFFGSVALAWLCMKFYDAPVRKWLAGRFLKSLR